jgi:hypothetical protein
MKPMLLALLLCLPMAAQDATVTLPNLGKSGNDYLRSCEALTHNDDFSVQSVQCSTFIKGVVEGLTAYQIQSHGGLVNMPPNITVPQLEKIVVRYMNDHPKALNLTTSQIILWALMDAYPAAKK